MSQTRRLAAILAADVAGYSRLMGADEEGTLERLKALRCELLDPKIAEHRGRIVKTTGDGMLVEFASVVDAVRCAVAVQQAMPERNSGVAADSRIELRIGINLGDVIVEGDDLYGDGVNIAARIEALADAGGVFVSNTVHDQVPFVFEDLGERQVKNITRPVRVYRVRPESPLPNPPLPGLDPGITGEGSALGARVRAAEPPALAVPAKPSIAVLPFANMSGDPEQEYFADGMVEEIITALSRIRWLFVIARNSSFTYKGQAVDVKQVGRELGVRYVLEGSVRKAGGRVRITAQLINATNGAHLWADRFDGSLEDVFDLQDQVATSVAGVIEPALQAEEDRRSVERPTQDLTAYDLYLRAARMATGTAEGERLKEAAALLQRAIARDPHYGPALGTAAVIRIQMDAAGATNDSARNQAEAIALARRGVEAAPDDPAVLRCAGFALGYFGEDIAAAITLVDRSLGLNPSNARAWRSSGILRIYAGDLDPAIEHLEKSIRLDPRANMSVPVGTIGIAHFFAGRFELALPKFLAAIQQMPSYRTPYRFLTACYAHLGRLTEAREMLAKVREMHFEVEPRISHWRKPEHQELLLSGLRLAAGEEK